MGVLSISVAWGSVMHVFVGHLPSPPSSTAVGGMHRTETTVELDEPPPVQSTPAVQVPP
jgi:hypothetical protein